jgi:hypothetical protein
VITDLAKLFNKLGDKKKIEKKLVTNETKNNNGIILLNLFSINNL